MKPVVKNKKELIPLSGFELATSGLRTHALTTELSGVNDMKPNIHTP